MSAENVGVVRASLEAYLAGDNQAALAYYDPEVEFDANLRPEGGIYRGHAGVAEAMRSWTGTWENWKVEVLELIDAGEHVLAVCRESGRGKGSGIVIDHQVFLLFTVRDGKIIRWKGFLDREEAIVAAGLQASGSELEASGSNEER